jgi:hypothetical protein
MAFLYLISSILDLYNVINLFFTWCDNATSLKSPLKFISCFYWPMVDERCVWRSWHWCKSKWRLRVNSQVIQIRYPSLRSFWKKGRELCHPSSVHLLQLVYSAGDLGTSFALGAFSLIGFRLFLSLGGKLGGLFLTKPLDMFIVWSKTVWKLKTEWFAEAAHLLVSLQESCIYIIRQVMRDHIACQL